MKAVTVSMILLLLAVVAMEWFVPVTPPPIPPLTPAAVDSADSTLLAQADRTAEFPSEAAYQSIGDRPLFFAGRRPPPPYIPDAKPGKPVRDKKVTPPGGRLTGIIVVGEHTYAMISGGGKKKGTQRVKLGDDLEGWKVKKITMDKLVLKNGPERHELPLREFKPVPLPKTAAKKRPKNKKAPKKPGARKGRRAPAVRGKRDDKD